MAMAFGYAVRVGAQQCSIYVMLQGKGARQSIPMMVPLANSCAKVAAGARHTLALLNDGSVVGFGANDCGQVSDYFVWILRCSVKLIFFFFTSLDQAA